MQYYYNYSILSPEQQALLVRNNKIDNIKRTVSGLGFAVFAAELTFQILYIILMLFINLTGVSQTEYFTENYVTITELFHGTVLFTGMFIVGLIYCALSNTKLSSIIKFEKVKKSNLVLYVLLGISIAYLGNILTSLLLSNFEAIGIYNNLSDNQLENNNLGYVVLTFVTAVTPAFAEEFLFRGVILGKLRKYGNSFAILGSAFLFAFMHGNLVQIPFAFVGGVFFAFITVKTNSLLPAMIIHFFNNFLSCVLEIVGTFCDDYTYNIFALLLFTFVFLAGIFAFVMLSIKDKKLFNINNEIDEAKEFTLKEKAKFYFLNIGMIFTLVILSLETLSSIGFFTG